MENLSFEDFVGLLRSALHYLYDPVQLRRSALVELLAMSGAFDQAAALQQRLIGAIRALKPAEEEPPQARAWRIYDILNLQYVRQLSREAVATQLGIGERQMRREQRLAIEALAQALWPVSVTARQGDDATTTTGDAVDSGHALSAELGWLKSAAPESNLALGELLESVRSLAQPLAEQVQVPLEVVLPDELLGFPAPQLALRTILLTTLGVLLPRAAPGSVLIVAHRSDAGLDFSITCNTPAHLTDEAAGLETAQELAAFYNARLTVHRLTDGGLTILLRVAVPEQHTLLVIDDNPDWTALVQRYLAGSNYLAVGCNEPAQATALAEKLQPAAILLDVMMHQIDGWEVLGALRNEPGTAQIPVVICTILPLEGMALALGATAFLQKPVAQHQLLELLARLGAMRR